MRMRPTPTWRTEFGSDYDVPQEVTSQLVDVSWGNDAAPSFVNRGDEGLQHDEMYRLWVEHPDPMSRDFAGGDNKRFVIVYGPDDIVFETDDVGQALAKMAELSAKKAQLAPKSVQAESIVAALLDGSKKAAKIIERGVRPAVDPTDSEAIYQHMLEATPFFQQAYDRFPNHNTDQADDAADHIISMAEAWFAEEFPGADFELIRDDLYEKIYAGLT